MAKSGSRPKRVDPHWPGDDHKGTHPVSELTSEHQGSSSPFGDVTFPLHHTELPYVHPVTEINK